MCMYYTGIDPFTKEEVYVARHLRDRKLERAWMQLFKPDWAAIARHQSNARLAEKGKVVTELFS